MWCIWNISSSAKAGFIDDGFRAWAENKIPISGNDTICTNMYSMYNMYIVVKTKQNATDIGEDDNYGRKRPKMQMQRGGFYGW